MCLGPSIKNVRKKLVIFNPPCPLLSASGWTPPLPHADVRSCIHLLHHTSSAWAARDGWLVTESPLTDACASCHRPRSHRQQTSSNPSGPFSTARAVTVGWQETPARQALVPYWVVDVCMQSSSLPPCPHLSASEPANQPLLPPRCGRPLWTTPLCNNPD